MCAWESRRIIIGRKIALINAIKREKIMEYASNAMSAETSIVPPIKTSPKIPLKGYARFPEIEYIQATIGADGLAEKNLKIILKARKMAIIAPITLITLIRMNLVLSIFIT